MTFILVGCLVAPWLMAVYGGAVAAHSYAARAQAGRSQRTCLIWLTTLSGFALYGGWLVVFNGPWLARACAQTATMTFTLALVTLVATVFLTMSLEDLVTLIAAPPGFRHYAVVAGAALFAQVVTLLAFAAYNLARAAQCA